MTSPHRNPMRVLPPLDKPVLTPFAKPAIILITILINLKQPVLWRVRRFSALRESGLAFRAHK
jgi:hypothetical protein